MTPVLTDPNVARPDLQPRPDIRRLTERDDVFGAYLTLLGRKPDGPKRIAECVGLPLSQLLAGFIESAEFSDIQATLVKSGTLPARAPLTAADLNPANRWLAGLVAGHRPVAQVDWSDLLLVAMTAPEIIAVSQGRFDEQAVAALAKDVAERREKRAALFDTVTFDAAAFSASASNRLFQAADGTLDFDAALDPKAPPPVMLATFTEGLEGLRRSASTTLGDWLTITQDAALAGTLTHWLWHAPTYLLNRSIADDDLGEAPPADEVFIDFLAMGDTHGVSPHPLFCYHAYQVLNSGTTLGETATFRHFVTAGQASGARTSALFDPDFYLSRNPHVRALIASGRFASPLEHFVKVGLTQGLHFSPDFDRDYYLTHNPDIGQAHADALIPSPEWHYVFVGCREGRSPNRFFDARYYADRYPFIGEEMRRFGIASTLEHFLLLGRKRGWRVNRPLADRSIALDDGKALFEKRGRRAYGEIIDGLIAIPSVEAPGLSVIVPISGQADFTAGFLKSAAFAIETLKARRGIDAEIIVVDNGSQDHTATLLTALPAVRVERFDAPIGFPAAVNAGARAARGDILLVANNDIEFTPEAFDRIVATLHSRADVGVVGAKIILPNETLQEVGSVLDRGGSSHGLARGADAVEVRGARLVEVDYASGCFVGFRRSDFEALSAFDEAFSPGYYEEVDFSLRMKRDLAKTTVVDTGLAVTHYEHASFAKGRPQTVNEPLILRNRLRLKTAHAKAFQSMSAGDAGERAARSRAAMAGQHRILVVEDLIPSALLGSGFGRAETILDVFADMGIAFDIVALNGNARVDIFKDPRTKVFRAWMPGEALEDVLRDRGADYSHLWLCRTHNLARGAAAVIEAKARFGLKVICDTEALSSQRLVEQMRVEGRAVDEDLLVGLAASELSDPVGVDLWIAVNDRDEALMNRLGVGPVLQIGHSVTGVADGDDASFETRFRILFVGAVHEASSPNHESLEWFLTHVYPRLAPSTRRHVTIAGHWHEALSTAFRKRFADIEMDFQGPVSDTELKELYRESRLSIAPTRFAAGIPCKVIESVLKGVPTVMSDLLAEQLNVGDDADLAIADRFDDGVSFARWIDVLYSNRDVWLAQRDRQNSAIARAWSPDRLRAQVAEAIDRAD